MAKKGETTAPWMERARARIEASGILDRLLEFILADPADEDESKRPSAIMTDSQARAAFQMLKKCMPDLANRTVHVKVEQGRPTREMTLDALMLEWEERTSSQANSPASKSVN